MWISGMEIDYSSTKERPQDCTGYQIEGIRAVAKPVCPVSILSGRTNRIQMD